MKILGISAFYHDSAAALVVDGELRVALEEERFSRIKHDNAFPKEAISKCLELENLSIEDIDHLVYYEKPLLRFERLLDTFIETFPFALRPFLKSLPEWLGQKIKVEDVIRKETGYKGQIIFLPHHFSHAASGYFSSDFKEAAIMTIDGVGEYQTTVLWEAMADEIKPLYEINFPHSLGLLYSTFTAFLGFRVNEGEYKMMGMAAYGEPKYVEQILQLVDIKSDGSFQLNLKYFSFREKFRMWSPKFEKLFGKPRREDEKIEKRHEDLAASIQVVAERIYFDSLRHLHRITNKDSLVVSGGVALNSLANGRILKETPFKDVHIFGPSGDGGAAIGGALFVSALMSSGDSHRKAIGLLTVGNSYQEEEILKDLKGEGLPYKKLKTDSLLDKVSDLLKQGSVVSWFAGRMEFGPRALGSRSILASPQKSNNGLKMKDRVNLIKKREKFRPFAGSVLESEVATLFELPSQRQSWPYMNFVFKVKENQREQIGAIVHRDMTCRIQTVARENGRYYDLLKEFHKKTGIPCLLNTSFNVGGEPIVESPKQALKAFRESDIDILVLENFLIEKPLSGDSS